MQLSTISDYKRYGRQMILDGFGLEGQVKLQNSSVIVVGAGGLGCPALLYLCAAGIGKLGVVDHDTVELSNLQRQILHSEDTIGISKCASACIALKRINIKSCIIPIDEMLSPYNALSILEPYDVVLDCTDNAPTRYLLSDSCVALGKPLVSGAAQRYDGQLCVYNLGEGGPCYRCLFPSPPSPENVSSCEETGVLGAVTGIIGNLQALEAIKIITGLNDPTPMLHLYAALSPSPFRSIKIRRRKPSCPACGRPENRVGNIQDTDYVQFCGGPRPDWVKKGLDGGNERYRISVTDFNKLRDKSSEKDYRVLDVRSRVEFGICHLPRSINVPLSELVANPEPFRSDDCDTYVVCRLGNDSQIAVDALRHEVCGKVVKDVIGGLQAWSRHIDPDFPVY